MLQSWGLEINSILSYVHGFVKPCETTVT